MEQYISAIVTAVVAIVGAYVAMKNANNKKFEELGIQIARISQQVEDLKSDVEKHNQVVERTVKVENSLSAAWHRIDELREKDEKIEAKMERLHG